MGALSPLTPRNMDMFDLISRSFRSKTSSTHLRSLNLRNALIKVDLEKSLEIRFRVDRVSAKLKVCANPVCVKISGVIYKNNTSHWKTFDVTSECLNFTARDYLLHFVDVFSKPVINVFYYPKKEKLGDDNLLKDIAIQKFICRNFKKQDKILQHASNCTKSLLITAPCSSAHQILTKNFEKLIVCFPDFDLNSLLIMNTAIIEIRPTKKIRGKDLNLFLKHWMYGVSNCYLEYLEIRTGKDQTGLNREAIGKGIWCQQQPRSLKRTYTFKDQVSGDPRTVTVHGGYDIQRDDGVQATFNYLSSSFHFIIWD